MRHSNLKKLVMAAMFAALTTVMTMVIQVPSPTQGFLNLGDCSVLLSAWILGPLYGGAAAGIGSMLADILSSYTNYAPGTLVIKFAMGAAAGFLFQAMKGRTPARKLTAQLVSAVVAEAIMVLGYFGYCAVFLSYGLAAAVDIPGNLVQAAFGLITATVVYTVLDRSHTLERASL